MELISLILSFLDHRSLRTVSTVSRLFCAEAEFHLYFWVNIRTYPQYISFHIATLDSPKRRARVSHITYTLPNSNFLNNFLLAQFPNLVSLNLDMRGLFDPASILIPREGFPFKLRSILCDLRRVDDSFLRFIEAHPTLTEIDVICADGRNGDILPNANAPSLERVACPLSTVPSLVPGHPVTRFELIGTVNESDVVDSILPILRKSSRPIERLSIMVMDCSPVLFEEIAASLPNLTILSVDVVDPTASNFSLLHTVMDACSDSSRFTAALSRLHFLQHLVYRIPHWHCAHLITDTTWASRLPALQSVTLFEGDAEVRLVRDATRI